MKYLLTICLSLWVPCIVFGQCNNTQYYVFPNDGNDAAGICNHGYDNPTITNNAGTISAAGGQGVNIVWNPDFTGIAAVSLRHTYKKNCNTNPSNADETFWQSIVHFGTVPPMNVVSNQAEVKFPNHLAKFNYVFNNGFTLQNLVNQGVTVSTYRFNSETNTWGFEYKDHLTTSSVYSSTQLWGVGTFRFKFLIETSCNSYWTEEYSVSALPVCADITESTYLNDIGVMLNAMPTPLPADKVLDGGYALGGGYKLDNGNTYALKLYTDALFSGSNYSVVANNPAAIVLGPYNGNSATMDLKVNTSLGSYLVEFIRNTSDPLYARCPNVAPVKIFVGGKDAVLPVEPCLIIIPQYFYDKKIFVNPSLPIFENFIYTVKSAKGIIVKPGVILKTGAHLVLLPADKTAETVTELSRNFAQSTVYDDEERVIAQSRSYFDERGRNIQSQSKSLSQKIILAAENKYDMYDRVALSTLPAPVSSVATTPGTGCLTDPIDPVFDMAFAYKDKFIEASGATAYDYTHFDDTKVLAPDAVDGSTPGTLGWYYSANNGTGSSPLKETGVANTSYPYSRTLYRNDGTNRVIASTQPGDQYKAGSDKYGSNDVIKFGAVADATARVVAITDDTELPVYLTTRNVSVFPPNENPPTDNIERPAVTGLLGSVTVQKVTDMNGLQSFTYLDEQGKAFISVLKDKDDVVLSRSYTFYNDMGQTVCTITPNGVKQLMDGADYDAIDKTTFTYDGRGRLKSSTNNDAGTTQFIYRLDGTLRFSQNAEQALARAAVPAVGTTPAIPAKVPSYSYINYDEAGRPVESGEFTPAGNDYAWGSTMLKAAAEIKATVDNNEYLTTGGAKSEVHKTHYDEPNTAVLDGQFTIGKVAWIEKDNGSQTHYSYDERGRIIKTVQVIPGLGNKSIAYKYHPNGQVKEVAYQAGQSDAFYHVYAYDADGRMFKTWTGSTAPSYDNNHNPVTIVNEVASGWGTLQAEYVYYKHGPLKSVKVAGVQTIDYTYTAQGLLKAINNPDNLGTGANADIFAEQLEYFSGDYVSAGSPLVNPSGLPASRFDGLPVATVWRITKPDGSDDHAGYKYTYDSKYQLADAQYGTMSGTSFNAPDNKFREGSLSYDANGNMLTLSRYNGNTTPGLMHDFTAGNKFKYAYQQSPAAYNNRMMSAPGYAEYNYNSIGQMTGQKMLPANVQRDFAYNASGLTSVIKAAGANLIDYNYDAGGQLLVKNNYLSDGQITTYYVRDGSGNVMGIYEKRPEDPANALPKLRELPIYGSSRLGSVYYTYSTGVGEVPIITATSIYELKDHLGSTRARFLIKQNNTTEINSYASYYPFGLPFKPEYHGPIPSRNGYQGGYSECEEEIGQNFFQLRMYDPVVGRWNSMDPYGQYPSPYEGMGNNPVNGVDPDGGNNSTHTDENGKVRAVYNDGDLGIYSHVGAKSKADIDKNYSTSNTSAGGKYMGKTMFWDEFMSFDQKTNAYTGPDGRIDFGKSWEPAIDQLHAESRGMSLTEIGTNSKLNARFDLKNDEVFAPFGVYTGKLIGGNYFSARSAGNFLAGYNANGAKVGGYAGVNFEGYMRLAGYYNMHNEMPSKFQANLILMGNHVCGPAPYYGENPYTGRMVKLGWYNQR